MAVGMTPLVLFGGYYAKKGFESLYDTFSNFGGAVQSEKIKKAAKLSLSDTIFKLFE